MKSKALLILAMFMVSCTPTVPVIEPPVIVIPVPNIRIYNSAWEIPKEGYVELSRTVTSIQEYQDYVDEYNATHTDDQLFLIEGEAIIPIEDAPPADCYIVDPTTHDIIREYIDWPRIDLSERREVWRFQCMADGGVLYVDQIPPPPIPIVDDRPAYEKWALYLIYTDTGVIKHENHMTTEADYISERAVYETAVASDGGLTYLVAGRLYP